MNIAAHHFLWELLPKYPEKSQEGGFGTLHSGHSRWPSTPVNCEAGLTLADLWSGKVCFESNSLIFIPVVSGKIKAYTQGFWQDIF